MPARTAVSPTAKVTLPQTSNRPGLRVPDSWSDRYDQIVPAMPIGTETKKTARQCTTASRPPRMSPRKDPAMPATWLMPSAMPRRSAGKVSVMMAVELAKSMDPPTAWTSRHPMSHIAPCPPVHGSSARATAPIEKTTNPAL